MAKNYTIDIDYLHQLSDMFANFDEDEIIHRDYLRVNEYIKRLESNYHTTPCTQSLIARIQDDASLVPLFKPFYPLVRKLVHTTHPIDEFNLNRKYQECKISNDDALRIVGNFFKKQGDFFYKQFLEFMEESEGHLQYVLPNDCMDGEILYLHSVGEAFVSIASYPNICKVSITSHELTHVTDAFNNPEFHENLLIREISSVFMEMIATDYLNNVLALKRDNILRRANLHIAIKERAMDIRAKTELLTLYRMYQNNDDNTLFEILKKKGFDKEDIEYYESDSLIEDYYYILAQLVAIELYYIYQKDKNKALGILQNIILNATDSNILNLLGQDKIILAKNLDRYESELVKSLNKDDIAS